MCTKKDLIEKNSAESARNYEAVELRVVYFTAEDVFTGVSTDVGGEYPTDWE